METNSEGEQYIQKIENVLSEGRMLMLEVLSHDDCEITKEISVKCNAWLKRVLAHT